MFSRDRFLIELAQYRKDCIALERAIGKVKDEDTREALVLMLKRVDNR